MVSRRSILQAAGAALLVRHIPSNLLALPVTTAAPSLGSLGAASISPAVVAFFKSYLTYASGLKPIQSEQFLVDIEAWKEFPFWRAGVNGEPDLIGFEVHKGCKKMFPKSYWTRPRRLALAWHSNIVAAVNNARLLEELLHNYPNEDRDIAVLKNSLASPEFLKVIAGIMHTTGVAFPISQIESHNELAQGMIHIELERFRIKFKWDVGDLISKKRNEIRHGYELPLEDGCLDGLVRENDLGKLLHLLENNPELLPTDKLRMLRIVAVDLQNNGRQTISFDHYREGREVNMSREFLLTTKPLSYRLGLSDLQLCATKPLLSTVNCV